MRYSEVTAAQAADRLAIRELFDAYAHHADRREAEAQKALFTEGTRFAVYMDGANTNATYIIEDREGLTPIFEDLRRYDVTTHFNGQHTVELAGETATAEGYTLAHHVYTEDQTRKLMVASLRYRDRYTKIDGQWYYAARDLIVDWTETRFLNT